MWLNKATTLANDHMSNKFAIFSQQNFYIN